MVRGPIVAGSLPHRTADLPRARARPQTVLDEVARTGRGDRSLLIIASYPPRRWTENRPTRPPRRLLLGARTRQEALLRTERP